MKPFIALGLCLLVAAVHCQPLLPPEFTAKLDIKWGDQSYDATVYVNTKTLSAPIVQARAKATFTPSDKTLPQRVVSSVYISSLPGVFNFFTGFSNADGAINLDEADCAKIPVDTILDQATGNYAPLPVDQSKKPLADMYKKACADCDGAFTTTVYRQLLTVLTKSRIPKVILGADKLVVIVTDFQPKNTLNLKDDQVTVPCNTLKQKVASAKPAAVPELIPAEQKNQIKLKPSGPPPIHKHPKFADALAKHIMGPLYEAPKKLSSSDAKKDPKKEVEAIRESPKDSPARRKSDTNGALAPAVKVRFSEVKASCDPTFRGDGECDAECNNKDNNWDFGDCCEGTCKLVQYYTRLLPASHPLNVVRRATCGSKKYNCQAPKKALCAFYHGFLVNGRPIADNGPEAFSIKSPLQAHSKYGMQYWANMASELEGLCSTVVYNNHETITNGWDETTLQNTYYNHAAQITQQAIGENMRPALFAHSMANMLLGGACLHQGKCGVQWTDLSGPIRGSRVAANPIASGMSKLGMKAIASLRPDFPGLATGPNKDQLSAVIAGKQAGRGAANPSNLLVGAACGFKGVGALLSPHLIPMAAVKLIVYGYRAEADGVVGMDECELYGVDQSGEHVLRQIGDFSDTDPLHPYYHYPGNHMTATGSEGDAGFMLTYIRSQVDGFAKDFLANIAADAARL